METASAFFSSSIPATKPFIVSLAQDDNVSIIRFGTQAKVSLNQFIDLLYKKNAAG